MKKKITIGISQINNCFSGAYYLPYVAGLLESYFKKYVKKKKKYKFLEPLLKRINVQDAVRLYSDADIVGFSLYSWNEQISLSIAKKLKALNRNVKIIFGGPQVPNNSEIFLKKHTFIDYVIHGEGEKVFLDLVESFENNNTKQVSGISWLNKYGVYQNNSEFKRIRELECIPSPYLTGIFDRLIEAYPKNEWLILWETNRGCPFKCTFCDWGSATASKVNKFDLERLKLEIDWFSKNKIEFIFCCDANFGILKRDIEIAEYVAIKKKSTGYPKVLSVQNTKNTTERAYQTQKILADAGLNKGVTLSMQSLDPVTLHNIKRDNISLQTYDTLQKLFTKNNVTTYSDLILALPGETFDSFTGGVSNLIQNGQHNRIQFNNLSILPNSEIGESKYQKKFGIKTVETDILNMHGFYSDDDCGISEKQKLVVATDSMPKKDWQKTRAFSWMTAFLHFNKILQIPIIIYHHLTGQDYKTIINFFVNEEGEEFKLISKIRKYFFDSALKIQNGGPEYKFSKEWLNIWWPHDEYMLLKLYKKNLVFDFYKESENLLLKQMITLDSKFSRFKNLISQSIMVNYEMLKLPKRDKNYEVTLNYNIIDFYKSVLVGKQTKLKKGKFNYRIERKSEKWLSNQDWAKKVVWYANKKGAYLYGSKAMSKYYSAHH
jgi:radical SAM superfamily enzyme YgiQ (UPF0313 family)